MVSLSTGLVVNVGCQTHGCAYCGPRQTRRLAMAVSTRLGEVNRARFVTLTNAPADFQTCRQKMRDLRRYLKRRGYTWEAFWSLEHGTQTGMLHAHCIQHGDYIPQAELQATWGQIVDIRAVRSGKVSGYVLKDAARVAGYALKGQDEGHGTRIAVNGGRPAHWTRAFFGRRLEEVYAQMQTGDTGPWEMLTLASAVAETRKDRPNV